MKMLWFFASAGLAVLTAANPLSFTPFPTAYRSGTNATLTTSNSTWTYSQKKSLSSPSLPHMSNAPITLSIPSFTSFPTSHHPETSTTSTALNPTWKYPQMNTSTTSNSSKSSVKSSRLPLPTGYTSDTPSNSTIQNATWAYSRKNVSSPAQSSPSLPPATLSSNETWAYSLKNSSSRIQAMASPKGVFAHFMVGNCKDWSVGKWETEILLAKSAHIDAFALNIAYNEGIMLALSRAFDAAENAGFKLFFSFDYAGHGAWPKDDVINLLLQYQTRWAYYQYNGPFVSTFEGPGNAEDWFEIKAVTGCFFMPDWSSVGARDALRLANGVADGLFSWAAWPWGNTDSDTYVDASYKDFLKQAGNKPYMMPVSPWFYTNMPGFNKNWLWRGDDLWRDRWEQVMFVQPEFVQIISWNDYGESHYIGPLHDDGYEAFAPGRGNSPYNYAIGMPHEGWLTHLPYVIDMYKKNIGRVTQESLVTWYRLYPGASVACGFGGTTGNTATQLLVEFEPNQVAQDKIFFSALLTKDASVSVTVGGVVIPATWADVPFDKIGIFHGSASFGSLVGPVVVTVSRSATTVARVSGPPITTECIDNVVNWNAWVGADPGQAVPATLSTIPLDHQVCTMGTAPGNFKGLCEFTCQYGYCPLGACQCLSMGPQKTKPTTPGQKGYPIAGLGSSYIGLCDFACNLGFCPPTACGPVEVPLTEPTVSPFLPLSCNSGTGIGMVAGLCSFSCNFGYCPIHSCTCLSTGNLNIPPASDGSKGYILDGSDDSGLCTFTCSRAYCPETACSGDKNELFMCDADDPSADCVREEPLCDLLLPFNTLDELSAAALQIGMPNHCKEKHAIQVLSRMLDKALTSYADVDGDYDSKFEYYVGYIKGMVPAAIHKFMDLGGGAGNKYFTCKLGQDGTQEPCPIDDFSNTGSSVAIYYTLNNEAGFYEELSSTYGILREWVAIGTEATSVPVCTRQGCSGSVILSKHGFPIVAAAGVTVPNPKDIITTALPMVDNLRISIGATFIDVILGQWDGNLNDALQVLSVPVLMFTQAVESMKEIKDIADDAEEEEKKNLIITIVSIILMFLPFVGEFTQVAAGLTNLARIILLVEIAGNAALSVVDIIGSEGSAPMAILGLLLAGGVRTPRDFGTMASTRRGMSTVDIAKLGIVFKKNDDKLQNLIEACAR